MRNCPELRHLPIDSVRPYKKHTRQHPKSQIEKLKTVLRYFGQVVPIIVDEQNTIVDGHAIWQAQRELGADEVIVVTMVGRNPADVRALRLALNRVAEEGAWNQEILRSEISELLNLSIDLKLTGFDAIEIDHILEIDVPQIGRANDMMPGVEETAVSSPGDIWLCGRHRIGCGDPRDPIFTEKVCDTRAGMAFLDPTHTAALVARTSLTDKTLARQGAPRFGCNEEIVFVDFLIQSLSCLKAVCATEALIYAATDWPHIGDLLAAGRACGLSFKDLCVWSKAEASAGTLYSNQHELFCIFTACASEFAENVALCRRGKKRSNLWTYNAAIPIADESDPAKPVVLVADAIRDATKRGGVVVDTFLGSGVTLIAAQETGRVCAGIEKDPRYVDLAIRRWQRATGQQAHHRELGKPFDQCGRRDDTRQEVCRG